jgi:hypothetical protein
VGCDDPGVVKAVVTALVAGLLLVPAGCGGDESALCQSLGDLRESVESLRDVELNEGAVDEIRQAADDITEDVQAVKDAADEELGTEATNLETAVRSLITDVETAIEGGNLSTETLALLSASLSGAVTAYDALVEAAPDC